VPRAWGLGRGPVYVRLYAKRSLRWVMLARQNRKLRQKEKGAPKSALRTTLIAF
jgi:hypothetical protein